MTLRQTGSTKEGVGLGPRKKASDILAEATAIRRTMQTLGYYDAYITSGVFADRPEAAIKNRFYVDVDSRKIYFDNGSAWVDLTIVADPPDYTHEHVHSHARTELTIIKPLTGNLYTGTLTSGSMDSIKTMFDGTNLHVTEVVGAPGFHVEAVFYEVSLIDTLIVQAFYDGATTHSCRIYLYNYNTLAYDTIHTMTTSKDFQQHYKTVPGRGADYISAGTVSMHLYHSEAGNAAHELYVDAMQLGYYK